jgi:hypothetical protein
MNMATGIRDKVAILGMGCSKFGERWDMGGEDLLVEAFQECIEDAGIEKNEIQAAWLGTCFPEISVGQSALPLSMSLRLPNIPVTRVENFCASGTESFRGAVYAVASGAYDICLAAGVEKLKDTGYGGLPEFTHWAVIGTKHRIIGANQTAPGMFAMLATRYFSRYGLTADQRARNYVGAYVKMFIRYDFSKTMYMTNRINLFSQYNDKPQNIDLDWEMAFIIKLGPFFNINLYTHMIYDDDIKLPVYDSDGEPVLGPNGKQKTSPGLQFKQYLNIGFRYKF